MIEVFNDDLLTEARCKLDSILNAINDGSYGQSYALDVHTYIIEDNDIEYRCKATKTIKDWNVRVYTI